MHNQAEVQWLAQRKGARVVAWLLQGHSGLWFNHCPSVCLLGWIMQQWLIRIIHFPLTNLNQTSPTSAPSCYRHIKPTLPRRAHMLVFSSDSLEEGCKRWLVLFPCCGLKVINDHSHALLLLLSIKTFWTGMGTYMEPQQVLLRDQVDWVKSLSPSLHNGWSHHVNGAAPSSWTFKGFCLFFLIQEWIMWSSTLIFWHHCAHQKTKQITLKL